MEKPFTSAKKSGNTFLFALLFLFFIQLGSMWIEGIYRLSLVKLGPGRELYGFLLLLLPAVLFIVGEKCERGVLWGAVLVLLGARLVCPTVGPVGQVVAGGVGVSMFLIILAYAFSARYSSLKGDMGQAVGIAVLLSVSLRSWGASIDISTEGTGAAIALPLTALALHQFRAAMTDATVAPAAEVVTGPRSAVAMLGLFANITLVSLVFSCPEVVCAWTGYAELGSSGVTVVACVAGAFVLVLLVAQWMESPPRWLVGGWNVLLMAALVGGCLAGMPMLPTAPGSAAVFVNGDAPFARGLLCLALLLAPVVVFNVRHLAGLSCWARPRNAVLPVMAGTGLLFALALFPILSNTWGYVPFGPLFRNRFYLPFLAACLVMLMPWVLRRPVDGVHIRAPKLLLGGTAVLIAVLAVAGACMRAGGLPQPKDPRYLTVLTYNMQQGSHAEGNRNYSKQLELLRRLNPDIIGLQECDTVRPSGGGVDAVRYLAESLGYHAYYGPGAIAGTFGAAILSRYPIRNARTFFTYSDSDEVGTVVGEIDVNGRTMAFFSSHPAGGDSVMTAHVNALKAEAGKYERVIAVGDYNFTAQEPYFASLSQLLQDSAMTLGEAKINNHGGTPNLAGEIDHIFVSRNFRVLESHYLSPPDSETDHPAHWSVVEVE